MTWPTEMDPEGELSSQWKPATEFLYPDLPRRDGSTESWQEYPRNGKSSDLATMRVEPSQAWGWFVVERLQATAQPNSRLAFAFAWERSTFPWLMTWEENRSRATAPWDSRTLCRGLEATSYAFATSKRDNVTRGSLFDTPCFEWLDAYEEKTTSFHLSLCCVEDRLTGPQMCKLE